MNNSITSILFKLLENKGIKTHFIKKINERDQLCKSVEIVMVEVIVRNIIAGSMAKRLGIEEGTKPSNTIMEICYKNDEFGDPLINEHHAVAMELATYEELKLIFDMTGKINIILQEFFKTLGITLVDFKLEFGRTKDGEIILADEISPDTCRLWDKQTGEKLDKDRFRRDLGHVEGAYQEVLKRLVLNES
jgi:phosphoribosylaminoimidazole-succinocarboxamide synthase